VAANTTFGKLIRAYRDGIGISQAQLASCAALSQGYLSQIENNEVQNPSASVLFRLARALHIDPQLLLEAAGYAEAKENGHEEMFDMAVDPDLLAFLVRVPSQQQRHLLRFLQSLEKGAPFTHNRGRSDGQPVSLR